MIEDVQDSNSEIIPTRKPRQDILSIQKTSYESTQPQRIHTSSKECRICLESQQADNNPLVAPCRCTGSVKYVHDVCYRKWIGRMYENKDKRGQTNMIDRGINCQLCKENIELNFSYKCGCISCESFKQKVQNNTFVFSLFLCFIIINLGSMCYLLFYTLSNSQSFKGDLVALILVVASFVFLGLTLFVTSYYFIGDYLIMKKWALQSYAMAERVSPRPNKRYQVHPMPSVQELAD